MTRLKKYSLLALCTFALVAQAEPPWHNRPAVIRAAETLVERVEQFDEVLHAAQAAEPVIGKVHHFEETVMEFAEEVRTCTFVEAEQEMRHIREDVQMLRQALLRYPRLFYQPKVQSRWNSMRMAYRYLDHAMYNNGGTTPPAGLTLNGAQYQLLEKGTLVSTPNSVSGTGSLTFKDPLKAEDNNYTLAMNLEDQGSVTLAANSDAELKAAVKLTFTRQGKALKVVLAVGDKKDDLSEEFSEVPADAQLKLSIDIHGHGHIVIWVGDGDEQEYSFTGDLEGKTWGLLLDRAAVTAAKVDKAKDVHGDGGDH